MNHKLDKHTEACPLLVSIIGGVADEYFTGYTTDSKGNIYCIGNTRNSGSEATAFIIKYDKSLNLLYHKYYGNNEAFFYGCTIDNDDNLIIVGSINNPNRVSSNGFILTFDSELKFIRSGNVDTDHTTILSSVVVDKSDNIYCTGYASIHGSEFSGIVIKLNPDLDIIHSQCYQGQGSSIFNEITLSTIGDVIVVGHINDDIGTPNGLIVTFTNQLKIMRQQRYVCTDIAYFSAVTCDDTGTIYAGGYGAGTSNEFTLVTFNLNLRVQRVMHITSHIPTQFCMVTMDGIRAKHDKHDINLRVITVPSVPTKPKATSMVIMDIVVASSRANWSVRESDLINQLNNDTLTSITVSN